jgi:serine/threonine-protein phosphatase 2B catalytic subunit
LKDSSKEEGEARKEILRTKVKAVARLTRIFKNLRENSEMLVAIKKMAPDGKIPRGLLMHGRPAIRDIFREFN